MLKFSMYSIHIHKYMERQYSVSTDRSDVTVPSYGGHQGGSTDRTPPRQDPVGHSPTLTQPYTKPAGT